MNESAWTAEWALLLECASPERDAKRLAELLHEKLDWSRLLALAEEHGVLRFLADRVCEVDESGVPQDAQQTLREKRRAQILFSMSLNAELFRMLEKFSAAGLEAMVMKGPVLSVRAYGDAGIRRYEDLDLLVRQRDIQPCAELLIAEGYEPKIPIDAMGAGRVPGEYFFKWPNTNRRIEVHTEETLRYFPRRLPVEEFFTRQVAEPIDAHSVPALCLEDEVVLVCVHNAKHFWERLMWVADVAALITRQKQLDWGRALATAREVGAERMLILGVRLAEEVFQVKVPEKMERLVRSDRGAARMAEGIIWRLPLGGGAPRGVPGRAVFRIQMRGGLFSGATYLLRLTLFPTEEDWGENNGRQRWRILEMLQRPLRLAQKYRRKSEG